MLRAVRAIGIVALVALVALGPPPASAAADDVPTALYVATDGHDDASCGAIDAPCSTVSEGVSRAKAAIAGGALEVIVRLAAGTYDENVDIGVVASGSSLSLIGTGASTTVIDGLGSASTPASVITVASGTVTLGGLSITGGYAASGGGIHNAAGTLTISEVAVRGNTANAAGNYGGGGGGIYNGTGTLAILDSEVSNNTSAGQGYGGGIFGLDGGTVTIVDSTVSGNTASYYVGGIHNRGLLTITRSTVSDNTTQRNFGGGISNYGGTLVMTDSTMSGNRALGANTGKGGAIYNRGPATVINSTLSGNAATFGGGIHNLGSGALTVTYSTLAENTATRGGGGYRWEGGTITISNTILFASTCDAYSVIIDGGYNVSDTCTFYAPSGTSIAGSSTIGLAPLAANSSTGPQTMAIDTTSSAHHLVPGCTGTDARGLDRPGFGGTANCDAGAYELQGVAPVVTTDPQSQTFAIGSDATFTSAASGTPAPTVQWQAYNDDAWGDVPGATSTTLTLASVTHSMTGSQYRAVFTNGVATDATTAAAMLTVPVGALDYLVLSPTAPKIVAGGSQVFTAEGFDAFDNALGDVTAVTVFTGSADMVCAAATCTAIAPGSYTVTGTSGTATGTASVTVESLPDVPLPATRPVASGTLTDVPGTIRSDGRFTATASGFAPYAPVTFGIYSTPVTLGHAVADSSGTAVAHLQMPAGLAGHHTVVAAGMSPSLTIMYLEMSVFVVPGAAIPGDAQLAISGIDRDPLIWLGAGALLLIVLGALMRGVAFGRPSSGIARGRR
ncbi:MAG TPA: choice-of-anchor Q domain-containing protein [Microbacteriaceae bacterium]|nr:choice-of-anchor Q domain-containing protein [Microbacteriaceae bacterium]